jgi:hypothetical protein
MDTHEIARRRLYNQRLWGAPCDSPEHVVGWLSAMQSQEFAYAKWSVAQRTHGATNAAMDQALADGTILRTHVLRPTWHFVLPADVRWLLDLTAPRVNALSGYYYRQLGLDDAVFTKTNALFSKTLKGGRQLTRTEFAGILRRSGIAASGQRLGYILMRAELDAVIISGALRGKQQTYASFDERVPRAKVVRRDDALAELTRRYFVSRGPATLKDYLTWSSLTAAEGRIGLEMAQPHLEHEVVGGRTYWFAPSSPRAKRASPVVDLIQGYDEYVMSYRESKDVLQLPGRASTVLSGEPIYTHAILLDGHVAGHWKRVLSKSLVSIQTQLYRPLISAEVRALQAAVHRYGRFMGQPASLSGRLTEL